MKNYYEILEVDKKASQEIIEKAYRILVKRYHPDLQGNEYEKEMREINEAYAVLADEYKRQQYDKKLQDDTISIDEYEKIRKENTVLKNRLQTITKSNQPNTITTENYQNSNNTFSNMGNALYNEIKKTTNTNYTNMHNQPSRSNIHSKDNNGKKNIEYKIKYIGYIILTIVILLIIYQIPIVKGFFKNLYEDNIVFKAIVDVFKNTFTTKF